MQLDLSKPITQVIFARLVGIGPRAVTQLLAKGIISAGATGAEWLQQYTRHLREVSARHRSQDGKLDLVAERAALTLEQRQIAALKRRELEGSLVERGPLKAELGRSVTMLRDNLLNMSGRMSPVLYAAGTINEVQTLLDTEVRRTITDFLETIGTGA